MTDTTPNVPYRFVKAAFERFAEALEFQLGLSLDSVEAANVRAQLKAGLAKMAAANTGLTSEAVETYATRLAEGWMRPTDMYAPADGKQTAADSVAAPDAEVRDAVTNLPPSAEVDFAPPVVAPESPALQELRQRMEASRLRRDQRLAELAERSGCSVNEVLLILATLESITSVDHLRKFAFDTLPPPFRPRSRYSQRRKYDWNDVRWVIHLYYSGVDDAEIGSRIGSDLPSVAGGDPDPADSKIVLAKVHDWVPWIFASLRQTIAVLVGLVAAALFRRRHPANIARTWPKNVAITLAALVLIVADGRLREGRSTESNSAAGAQPGSSVSGPSGGLYPHPSATDLALRDKVQRSQSLRREAPAVSAPLAATTATSPTQTGDGSLQNAGILSGRRPGDPTVEQGDDTPGVELEFQMHDAQGLADLAGADRARDLWCFKGGRAPGSGWSVANECSPSRERCETQAAAAPEPFKGQLFGRTSPCFRLAYELGPSLDLEINCTAVISKQLPTALLPPAKAVTSGLCRPVAMWCSVRNAGQQAGLFRAAAGRGERIYLIAAESYSARNDFNHSGRFITDEVVATVPGQAQDIALTREVCFNDGLLRSALILTSAVGTSAAPVRYDFEWPQF